MAIVKINVPVNMDAESGAFTGYDDGDTILLAMPTEIRVGTPGVYYDAYYGRDFTFGNGTVTGGTATGLTLFSDLGDTKLVTVTGLNVPAVDIALAIASGDVEVLKGLLLSGNDRFTGSSGADWLQGYAGNDSIDGGSGNDTMEGGVGNDAYYVRQAGDIILEQSGGGTDVAYVYAASYTLPAHVENGRAQATGVSLTGNELGNRLWGGNGGQTLAGGLGDDTLDGGNGRDTLIGGNGSDTYYVNQSDDRVQETTAGATGGVDLVLSEASAFTLGDHVENGRALAAGSSLTGNTLANKLWGEAGSQTLAGGGGNDTLDGGAGADTMAGGNGNDDYYVRDAGDVVQETTGGAAGGTDTVFSAVDSYTLPTFVEIGRAQLDGATLVGNGLGNRLFGAEGGQTLDGGAGNDTLTGGTGADTFRFASPLSGNLDRVADFVSGTDRLQLEDGVFEKLVATASGGLDAANFVANTTGQAVDTDDYVIYETDTGSLYYDADGSGAIFVPVRFAILTGQPTLSVTDIFVT